MFGFLQAQQMIVIDTEWQDFIMDAVERDDQTYILSYQADFTSNPPQSKHRNILYKYQGQVVSDSAIIPPGPGKNTIRYIHFDGIDRLVLVGNQEGISDATRLRILVFDTSLQLLSDKIFGTERGAYSIRNSKYIDGELYVMGGSLGQTDTSVFWYHFNHNLELTDSFDRVLGDYPNGQYVSDFINMPDSSRYFLIHYADPANPSQESASTSFLAHYSKDWILFDSRPMFSYRTVQYYVPNNPPAYVKSSLSDCRFFSMDDSLMHIACTGRNNTYASDDEGTDPIILHYNYQRKVVVGDAFFGVKGVREQTADQPALAFGDGNLWASTLILKPYYDSTYLQLTHVDNSWNLVRSFPAKVPANMIANRFKAWPGNRFAIMGTTDLPLVRGGLDPGKGFLIILDSSLEIPTGLHDNPNLLSKDAVLQIYPNPANSGAEITVKVNEMNQPYTMNLYDLSGRVLAQWAVNPNENATLQLPPLASGLYLIQIPGTQLSNYLQIW